MKNNGIHIRVADVLYGVMKRRLLILLLTIGGLLIGMVLSGISYLRGEMSKEYLITSSFSINTQTNSGLYTSGYDFPSYTDINMATELVDSVSYVLTSDRMLENVIESLGFLGVTTKDIADNISFSQYNETQIVEMSLYWRSSGEGIRILEEINRQAPEMLKDVLGIGSVSVINNPSSKYLLGGSINVVLWGYMTFFGFAIGIGITLLELLMRPTLLNVQDLHSVFGQEVLCEIPEDPAFFDRTEVTLVEGDDARETVESLSSAAHILNTKLRKKESPQIIYVTSALRGEGKTRFLANLGIRLSDLEKKVLLVDFDVKNPQLGALFLKNPDYRHSLNALYGEDISAKEAVTSLTGYLDMIPTVLDREILSLDSSLFQIVRELSEFYDYVLIDTPPVGLSADPMSLKNELAASALFVVHYDMASMEEIREALQRIEKSGAAILGCVANGVQVSKKTIHNPAREREKLKRAKAREKSQMPLVNLEEFSGTEESDQDIKPLVAEFIAENDSFREDVDAEVKSEEQFVDRLFEEENSTASAGDTEEKEKSELV